MIKRYKIAFQNMCAGLCLLKVIFGPENYHVYSVFQILFQNLFKSQGLRDTVNQSNNINGERGLKFGKFKKIVEYFFIGGVPFKLDDDSDSIPVRLISQVGNSDNFFVVNQMGYFFDKIGLIDLIWKLGYHNRASATI